MKVVSEINATYTIKISGLSLKHRHRDRHRLLFIYYKPRCFRWIDDVTSPNVPEHNVPCCLCCTDSSRVSRRPRRFVNERSSSVCRPSLYKRLLEHGTETARFFFNPLAHRKLTGYLAV